MKNLLTLTRIITLLSLISLVFFSCSENTKSTQVVPEENATAWIRIDSLLGIKEHFGQSVHADGQQLIFSTPKAIYTYPASGAAPQSFRFDKDAYTRPVYYRGVAYIIQSDTQIKCIPYATTDAPFYISLRELGALNSTRTHFAANTGILDALAINNKGQLLIQGNDNYFPQSLYQIQLDNRGRPVWDPARKSYQIILPDSVQLSIIRPYSIGDRFFIHSDYKLLGITDKSTANDLTANKDWNVIYVFPSGDVLYAVIYSEAESKLFLYQSTDKGSTWQRQAPVATFQSRWAQVYSIEDRLVISYNGRLEEFDVKTYSFRSLSIKGLVGLGINGVAEQNGKVYVAVESGGFFVKDLADFWN